ncbi:MAG: SGNH/GDSL hydrolase family protein [Herpetosiphonaceae bacterium]|nr:SGNH/GDSL hydrolase family protein [Herpetosiphonaceae bacterium]
MPMKRLIILLGILVVLLGTGGWYWVHASTPPVYTPTGVGDMYLGLGDSLAAGWNAEPGKGYVERLSTHLQHVNPRLVVRNLAVPGETTASFSGQQLVVALRLIKAQQAAGKRVSPITLTIGGNDAKNAERRPDAERHQVIDRVNKNLNAALDQLLAATRGPSGERTADIVVMTYYNPWGGDPQNTKSPAYWAAELNKAISAAAKSHGVALADGFTPFEDGKAWTLTYITNGDVHANNAGHQILADQFWQALQYK